MPAVFARQSELSIASALFYAAGGVISLASLTLFRSDDNPLNAASVLLGVLAVATSATFFVLGRRFPNKIALLLLTLASSHVLALVFFSQHEYRSMGTGLLFYTFLLYLVWFGPMWYARLYGYLWLAVYCVVMFVRFSPEVRPYLFSLVLTSILVGELIGMYKRRLEESSLTDPLCGVWNKRGLTVILERSIHDLNRYGRPTALLFADLDDFKHINDELGHVEGDRILREVAREFDLYTRPQDSVARFGGDEFALLMPDTDETQARVAAERLQANVTACSWSYGVAELRPDESADGFFQRADEAMFDHKQRHKQRRRSTLDSDS